MKMLQRKNNKGLEGEEKTKGKLTNWDGSGVTWLHSLFLQERNTDG